MRIRDMRLSGAIGLTQLGLLIVWHAMKARHINIDQRTEPPGRRAQPLPPHVPHSASQQTPSRSTPRTPLLQTTSGISRRLYRPQRWEVTRQVGKGTNVWSVDLHRTFAGVFLCIVNFKQSNTSLGVVNRLG